MAAPPRFLNSIYATHPDDSADKEVFFQAYGQTHNETTNRHVLVWWPNHPSSPTDSHTVAQATQSADAQEAGVAQIVQLTGQAGSYAFYSPVALPFSSLTMAVNPTRDQQFALGTFSRAQRDTLLRCAKEVVFEKTSVVNNCRVWARDLLEALVVEGLLTSEVFERVDSSVPLMRRRPELVD